MHSACATYIDAYIDVVYACANACDVKACMCPTKWHLCSFAMHARVQPSGVCVHEN